MNSLSSTDMNVQIDDLILHLEGNTFCDPGFNYGNPLPLPHVQNVTYQIEDYQPDKGLIFNYSLGRLDGTDIFFRDQIDGFDLDEDYIVAIGAAQTFGRGVQYPYCTLVGATLGVPCLNLGVGGVGPRFYSSNPHLMQIINNSKLCIINIMSPRSVDLPGFEPTGSCVYKLDDNSTVFWSSFVKHMKQKRGMDEKLLTAALVDQYLRDFTELADDIKAPALFANFSAKGLDMDYDNIIFPQYLTKNTVDKIKKMFSMYAEDTRSENKSAVRGLEYYLSQLAHLRISVKIAEQV